MEIILSTGNRSKIEQIKAALEDLGIPILSLAEAGVVGEVEEDGSTLEENAFKKAQFVHSQTGKWSMADDTGIFIDALDGEPGIHSARWAGPNATTEQIRDFALQKLSGVPLEKRTATFKTVVVIISPNGEMDSFSGKVRGCLLETPRTPCQPNMPYSGIFVPDGQEKGKEKVWAEMSVEEENAISHRGEAFRKVKNFFERLM